ncbi:protein of unknown function [Hyphomicrobium sp. 1Nfss2.1]
MFNNKAAFKLLLLHLRLSDRNCPAIGLALYCDQ